MIDCTIVIPCYNEAERLDRAAFARFLREDRRTRLLFVDDGSTDDTRKVLAELRRLEPTRMAMLLQTRNRGKAEAVRQGVRRALAEGSAYIGYWDADLATPLEAVGQFRRLLDERRELQLVLGARVQLLGRSIRRQRARHYLGRIFATAASAVLRLPVYDTQCGAKLFRAGPRLGPVFETPFETRWVFDVEVLARFLGQWRDRCPESRIYELPLDQWHDVSGSKVRARDFFRAFFALGWICWKYRREVRPARPAWSVVGSGEEPEEPLDERRAA